MNDYHLQKSLAGRQEFVHDRLEEGLGLSDILLFRSKLNLKLLAYGLDLILLVFHNGIEDLEYGVEHEQVESMLERLAISICILCRPFAHRGIEEIVTPKLGNELVLWDTKLLGVPSGKLTQGEGLTWRPEAKAVPLSE